MKSICDEKDFSKLYKQGKRWYCEGINVIFLEANELKMSVIASKKVGRAVDRNRAKRLMREAFFKVENLITRGYYVLIAKNDILDLDFCQLEKNLKWGLRRLKCLA
ncbi:ribonuclease P protein component [Campylobacter sp. MIT 99-7217]|nr:ribonuclease P protein component [Campylobacter sp. MIT 99-7217]